MSLILHAQTNLARRRVALTGIGTVSALGLNAEEALAGLKSGEATPTEILRFDASSFPSRHAFQIDERFNDQYRNELKNCHSTRREVQFGYIAALEALRTAKLTFDGPVSPDTLILGCGMGTDDFSWLLDASTQSTSAAAKPFAHHPSELGELLSEKFSAAPSVRTIHTACASSAQAIGEAYDLIASGQSKVILAGGADSMIEPIQLAGLSLLGALSPSKGNEAPSYGPFDQDRDGFVFGEGAAILVFEEWDHAISRGAPIFCELLGYGITQSAYRITDLNEDGSGPRDAVLAASVDANVPLAEISYVNAHGTGTKANDYVESKIIAELCPQSYVSTTKNLTGHMIAAAGAQEAILTVLALRNQILPPTINVKKQDLECKVRLTSARCAPHAMTYAMSNSIGFGGTNVSLIFGRHRHES